ncbi:hypothetical protein ACQ27_gp075 [Klebsiella phage K64-1]|nr:hypothetical protein ACQ27_gp075 [Klebsiella phage K64-1]
MVNSKICMTKRSCQIIAYFK